MGRYSLKAIFDKEPVAIAGAIRGVLWVLVLAGVLVWDAKLLAGVGVALELVLGLLARQAVTPTADPTLAAGTSLTVTTPGPTADRTVVVR